MSTKTAVTVYLFCNSGDGTNMQSWVAILDNGTIVKSHMSSSRGWGVHDTSPESGSFSRAAYDKALERAGLPPFDQIEWTVTVMPERQGPPPEVVEKYNDLAAASRIERSE